MEFSGAKKILDLCLRLCFQYQDLKRPGVHTAPSLLPDPVPLRADWATGVLTSSPRVSRVGVGTAWTGQLECSARSPPTRDRARVVEREGRRAAGLEPSLCPDLRLTKPKRTLQSSPKLPSPTPSSPGACRGTVATSGEAGVC